MKAEKPEKKVVVYAAYPLLIEASLAKAKLDAYGVPCFLTDEHLAALYPLAYFTAGQARLHIFEEDRARVREILGQPPGG